MYKARIVNFYNLQKSKAQNVYDVVVIGAGISGLAAAKALHDQGLSVIVFERYPSLINIGGAFLLFPNGVKALKALGLQHIVETLKVEINSASSFSTTGEKLCEGALNQPGGFYAQTDERLYTLGRTELQQLLLKTLEAKGVKIVFGHTCENISETADGVCVSFNNGTRVRAKYICGADGVHSTVRKYISPYINPQYINVSVLGGILGQSHVVNLQEFGIPQDQMVSHFGDDISLWLCPLSAGRQSFYIHLRISKDEFDSWNDKLALLKHQSQIWSQAPIAKIIIKHILAQGKTENSFAVAIQEIDPLGKWCSDLGRVALIGDAAHAFGSKLGFGVTLAFYDALLYAICVKQDALHQYQALRQPIAEAFYQLEKIEENETLTHDQKAIAKRDTATKNSAGKAPLFQGLVAIVNQFPLEAQIGQLQTFINHSPVNDENHYNSKAYVSHSRLQKAHL